LPGASDESRDNVPWKHLKRNQNILIRRAGRAETPFWHLILIWRSIAPEPIPRPNTEHIESDEVTFERWCRLIEVFRPGSSEKLIELFGRDPKLNGKSREEILFWLYSEGLKRQVEEAMKPDYHAIFTWQFALKLDLMIDKFNCLEELTCNEILSASVRGLLQESHYCFLHDLEKAAAITCGAALEEALKEVIPHRDGRWNLDQLLQDARDRSLLTDEEWGMADDVREFRNLAAHDPSEFTHRSRIQKISLLSNTRAVIEILLRKHQESSEEGS
jgi:hypothetical protein